MSQKQKSGLLYAAGITLALLGLVSQSAVAQEAPVQSNESLTVVRDALGHAEIATTSGYSHASADDVRAAVNSFAQSLGA
mgnify:CR=1 FL=1